MGYLSTVPPYKIVVLPSVAYNTSTIFSIVHFSIIFGPQIFDPTGSHNTCLQALPELDARHTCSGHVCGTHSEDSCWWSSPSRNDLGQTSVVDPNRKPAKFKFYQVLVRPALVP